jgi:hypothetical protein
MRYLEGEQAPFKMKADRDRLVGCKIQYLRHRDIDRTGRGYFFPQVGHIAKSSGLNLFFDNGDSLYRSEIAELVVIESKETSE